MGPEWREAQRVLEREGFELHPTAPASAATIARALTNNPRDPEVLGAIRALALMQGEEASEALAKMRRSAHPPFREAANQAWKQRWEQGLVDRR
jgi:hypothetical protein